MGPDIAFFHAAPPLTEEYRKTAMSKSFASSDSRVWAFVSLPFLHLRKVDEDRQKNHERASESCHQCSIHRRASFFYDGNSLWAERVI